MKEYIFYQPVAQDFQTITAMLSWAEANCPSYTNNDRLIMDGGEFHRLYFGQEKDFAWFQLRWS